VVSLYSGRYLYFYVIPVLTVEEVPMSKNTYSDQINNSYLYNNKHFYGKEDIDEMTEGENYD
jgi:hypothetical protein